jgi:cell division protein FtsL
MSPIMNDGRPTSTLGMAPRPFWKRHLREILLVALLLLAVHDVFGAHGFLAMWRTQKELKELRLDVDRLNKENNQMTAQVTALKTDPQTIEHIAREQMGLAKPGEMIFKLPPSAGSGDAANSH